MKRNNCFICNGKIEFFLYGEDFLYKTTKKKYSVYRCLNCHVEQILPVPKQKEIKKFYSLHYYSYSKAKKDFFLTLREKIIEVAYGNKVKKDIYFYLALIARTMFSGIPLHYIGKKRFLDVGCGNDYNIEILSKFGWTGNGFELGKKQKRGKIYFDADICNVNFEVKKFDYIRIWHVIEHVANPDNFLEKICNITSPDGVVVFGLPNTKSLYAKIFGRFWYNRDIPRHLINYNPENLTLILKKHKLKVTKVEYFSAGGFIGSIQHFLNYYLHTQMDLISNKLLVLVFLPLDILVRFLRIGDTISVEAVLDSES